MSELEDLWYTEPTARERLNLQSQIERLRDEITARNAANKELNEQLQYAQRELAKLKTRLVGALDLLHESVDHYPVEPDRHGQLWTTRVRKWLEDG